MNTLHKVVFASLVAVMVATQFSKVEAAGRYSGNAWVKAPSSSGSFTGWEHGARVLAIYASSDTASSQTNWFFLVATNPATSITGISSFENKDYRSPAINFPVSTTTASGYNMPVYKVFEYGDEGISFATAPYVYKSAATSGQARRVWLEIAP